ncbi:glycosyltransferase [Aurantimonas sp. DM33-3]|uniref:glycosyltransferase family 2 protein n=1 Tax=Aurantimonas sp. DM33-3 TaxID=2766955 RepID=UPI0016520E10|nr:glycosyltransferase family 2 protein [Aurantimonas sp. DM33-3]MBC6715563.1 glycosyltransferase [Aurantimonas sp. DM33-3]
MSIKAEVIIPSLGRLEVLNATLVAIRRLYPDLPIRVALQGDDCRDAVYRNMGEANFTVDYRETPGLIPALNASIRHSAAEICILLDDDAVPCDGWLEAHLGTMSRYPEAAYCYGREVNTTRWRSPVSELLRMGSEAVFGLFLPRETKLRGRIVGWTNGLGVVFGNFFLPGTCVINAPAEGNLAVRRALFLDSGGFDERFRGNAWGYGPQWGLRLAAKGHYGRYCGDAIMIHRQHASGGTRSAQRSVWYEDFVANNRLMWTEVGPFGWVGALPRLARRYFVR